MTDQEKLINENYPYRCWDLSCIFHFCYLKFVKICYLFRYLLPRQPLCGLHFCPHQQDYCMTTAKGSLQLGHPVIFDYRYNFFRCACGDGGGGAGCTVPTPSFSTQNVPYTVNNAYKNTWIENIRLHNGQLSVVYIL